MNANHEEISFTGFPVSKKQLKLFLSLMYPTLRLLSRSAWKGPNIVPLPVKEALAKGAPIRTNARSATILPQFVGLKFQVHNGKEYVAFEVSEDMVGSKLGEFAPTRKRFSYTQTKNK